MPGRIHLLGTSELYIYFVHVCIQEDGFARADTKILYEYYVYVYVQKDEYARAETSAWYKETI